MKPRVENDFTCNSLSTGVSVEICLGNLGATSETVLRDGGHTILMATLECCVLEFDRSIASYTSPKAPLPILRITS